MGDQGNNQKKDILSHARELIEEERFLEAIQTCDKAFGTFLDARDYAGAVHALADQINAWCHLARYQNNKWYARNAHAIANMMVSLAMENNVEEKKSLAAYRSGTACLTLAEFGESGMYVQAAQWFSEALEDFRGTETQKGDWMMHYGEALLKSGKTSEGQKLLFEGFNILKMHPLHGQQEYAYRVWFAGALMKLAEYNHRTGNLEVSKFYFEEAEKLVSSDPRLRIRKHELEQLKSKLGL